MIASIIRTKQPGHPSSYPIGEFEVYFLNPESVCESVHELSEFELSEQLAWHAQKMVETFNRCRFDQTDDRLLYSFEIINEESEQRKPMEQRR